MRKKNELSKLTGQLSRQRTGAMRDPSEQSLLGSTPPRMRSSLGLPRTDDMRSESLSSPALRSSGLQFGAPPAGGSHAGASSNGWSRLLMGGLSGVFHGGGGGVLSLATGLGHLVSGLMSLFGGGKRTPPPLQLFHLPDAQNETISIGAHPIAAGAVYGETNPPQSVSAQNSPLPLNASQSADIAHAVKLALLNSSALSDVISEL